jgi:hypothetical protein
MNGGVLISCKPGAPSILSVGSECVNAGCPILGELRETRVGLIVVRNARINFSN